MSDLFQGLPKRLVQAKFNVPMNDEEEGSEDEEEEQPLVVDLKQQASTVQRMPKQLKFVKPLPTFLDKGSMDANEALDLTF